MAEKSPSHQLELELATSNRQANKSMISRLLRQLAEDSDRHNGFGATTRVTFRRAVLSLTGFH